MRLVFKWAPEAPSLASTPGRCHRPAGPVRGWREAGSPPKRRPGAVWSSAMHEINYCNPTRFVVGPGTIAKLDELVAKGARVLVTTGGGSVHKNGVYDQV